MALILILLFVVLPLVELAVVVAAADAFGLGTTLVALLAFSVAGAWLMRRQGLAVWRRANDELVAGRPPTRELIDGAMIIGGGALLLTPGFVTDFVGLMLMLPPVRKLLAPLALRAMARRAATAVSSTRAGSAYAGGTDFPGGPGFPGGPDFPAGNGFSGMRTVIIDTDLFEDESGARTSGSQPGSAKVIRVEPLSPEDTAGELDSGD
ncbi:MAG: FxsA family protein [Actinomycetia bacterium]|nr:FxsA family protein [Actinomycetes bacterium]